MPAYISHAIMAEDMCREIIDVKAVIDVDEVRGYSLGADLAVLSKKVVKDPHDFYTRDFFVYLTKYIKDNHLEFNSHAMDLLYGHIAHYFFDINTHPLIYYLDYGCKRVGFLTNHDLIEGYLSSYLVKKILGKDIMDINVDYFCKMSLDKDICRLLNDVYGKVYGDYKISKSYKLVIGYLSLLETVIKSGIISKEKLIEISKFREFLTANDLSVEEIVNDVGYSFKNPITGEESEDHFMFLYRKSIEMSLDAIKVVDRYLYDGYSLDSLGKVFSDLSYNTGAHYSLGKEFSYVRKPKQRVLLPKKDLNSVKN